MGPYSRENLRDKKEYQEIILINGLDKKFERGFKEKNKKTRLRLRIHGYFYNVEDKNIYINTIAVHIGGAGIFARIIRHYNSLKYKKIFETAAKNKDWLSIYRHTKFLIDGTYGKAWFSFQFLPKDPQYLARPFAIVSAENPSMQVQSYTLNEINNNEMREVLSSLHYEFYPSYGELSDHIEKSYIIYDISEDKAIELGQKFQQESILFNDGNSIQILNCSDKKPVLQFEHKKVYQHETDADSQFDLAYKLATGDGVEQDIPKAIDLYEPIAQEKDLVAMHNVALLYCEHYGDDPEKLARGIQYFKYAANHGYDPSNCEMMKLHLIGFGVEKNHRMAVEYLLRTIDNGYAKCGKEYYRIIVSLKDFGESFDDRILIIEESNGVEVEYQILSTLLGVRNKDWFLKQQSLIKENDIQVDKMDIELLSGETKSYYFDITRSFGKFEIKKSHNERMNDKELLEFAIQMVTEYSDELNKDSIVDMSSDSEPHIYANIDGTLAGIKVKADMYPNHPVLLDDEKNKFMMQSKNKIFVPYFAPVSFYWIDGQSEEEHGWPIRNGAFHVNFKGLEKLGD